MTAQLYYLLKSNVFDQERHSTGNKKHCIPWRGQSTIINSVQKNLIICLLFPLPFPEVNIVV